MQQTYQMQCFYTFVVSNKSKHLANQKCHLMPCECFAQWAQKAL